MTLQQLSESSREALILAQVEARLLNHGYVGTEHLLLGLIHERTGAAARALAALGLRLEGARACVERLVGRGPDEPAGPIHLTPRAERALELAAAEARELGGDEVDTEHVLLGIVGDGKGVAIQLLREAGAPNGRVREAVLRALAPGALAEPLPFDSPRCPGCGRDLEDSGAIRTMNLPDGPDSARAVEVLFCRGCGRVASFPA